MHTLEHRNVLSGMPYFDKFSAVGLVLDGKTDS